MLALVVFCFLSEVGADRASDPTAGPLPGHFSIHGRVKGQDGALQHKGAQTGESRRVTAMFELNCSPLTPASLWRVFFLWLAVLLTFSPRSRGDRVTLLPCKLDHCGFTPGFLANPPR